jgi:hypothetical protein
VGGRIKMGFTIPAYLFRAIIVVLYRTYSPFVHFCVLIKYIPRLYRIAISCSFGISPRTNKHSVNSVVALARKVYFPINGT